MRRLGLMLVGAVVAVAVLSAPSPTVAQAASTTVAAGAGSVRISQVAGARTHHLRFKAAVRKLHRYGETRRGYRRSKFRHWIDANHDCQDTRAEVLVQESHKRTTGRCTVRRGRWRSYYDHVTTRTASRFDVDHLVPLAEAWDSGAKRWNRSTRTRYANDLHDRRVLVAVSAHSNRSKGDRDPRQWMPRYGRCRYAKQWTAVKLRWHLTVNRAEKRTLTRISRHCSNTVIRYRRAKIHRAGAGPHHGGGGGGTDPRFDYCYQAIDAGYGPYRRGKDPEYQWYEDRDHDGIVCET